MKLLYYFSLTLLLTTSLLSPAHGDTPEEQELDTILSATSQVERLSSDYIQEKHLAMLQKPGIVRGHFYYLKPDSLRWEQTEPEGGSFIVKGTKLKRRQGENGRVETTDLSREPAFAVFVNQVFAWCKGDGEWFRKRYEIKIVTRAPAVVLRLIPRLKEEKRFVDHLAITFSEDGSHVRTVEVETKDKDTITTNFINTVINDSLSKDLFQF